MKQVFFILIFTFGYLKAQVFAGFDFTPYHIDSFNNFMVESDQFFIPLPEDSIGLIKKRKEWILGSKDFKPVPTSTFFSDEGSTYFFELKLHETPWKSKILMMEEYYSPVSRTWHLYSYPDLKWMYSFHGAIFPKIENQDSLVLMIFSEGAIGSYGNITFYKDKKPKLSSLFFADEQLATVENCDFNRGKAKKMKMTITATRWNPVYSENEPFKFAPTKKLIQAQNVLELHRVKNLSLVFYRVKSTNPYHPGFVFPYYFETCWIETRVLKP